MPRDDLDIPYWQEIDRRVTYALNRHPHMILQLIPYGEDLEELKRYGGGDRASHLVARYAQARFSAFPNVTWCISNDREIVTHEKLQGRQLPAKKATIPGRWFCRFLRPEGTRSARQPNDTTDFKRPAGRGYSDLKATIPGRWFHPGAGTYPSVPASRNSAVTAGR